MTWLDGTFNPAPDAVTPASEAWLTSIKSGSSALLVITKNVQRSGPASSQTARDASARLGGYSLEFDLQLRLGQGDDVRHSEMGGKKLCSTLLHLTRREVVV